MRAAAARRLSFAALAAAFLAVLAMLAAPPREAGAVYCYYPAIKGAGPSIWTPDLSGGGFYYSALYSPALDAYRDAGSNFNSLEPQVGGDQYEASSDEGCRSTLNGRQWILPPDTSFGGTDLIAKEKLYADNRKPFGRMFVSLRNPTPDPIVIDLEVVTSPGSEDDTGLGGTSNAPGGLTPADAWAVTCDDLDGDGCGNARGEAVRTPEMAHNWERARGRHAESVDDADFSTDGEISVIFEQVRIPAGKTKAFMGLLTMSLSTKGARRAAERAGSNPTGYGAFKGLTKRENRRIVNW